MSNFRKIQNNGNWTAGETVSFEYHYPGGDGSLFMNYDGPLYSNNNQDETGGVPKGQWLLSDIPLDDGWSKITLQLLPNLPVGKYYLKYATMVSNPPEQPYYVDWKTQGIDISSIITPAPTPWLPPRPPDPIGIWDEDTGTWGGVEVAGGGRYKNTLVVVGQDNSGNGVIYYSEI
jgi:hypothetical protein